MSTLFHIDASLGWIVVPLYTEAFSDLHINAARTASGEGVVGKVDQTLLRDLYGYSYMIVMNVPCASQTTAALPGLGRCLMQGLHLL